MGGHRLHHAFGLANRAGHFECDTRKTSAQLVNDRREIVLEVPALRDEHRDDDDAIEPFRDHYGRTFLQGRREKLEESEFDSKIERTGEDR